MKQWINALQANPLRFITIAQMVSEEDLTEYREKTLDIAVRVNRFIAMHKGSESEEFKRGLALGMIFGLAGSKNNVTQFEVATDLQSLLGTLTAKNINVFTGEAIREEVNPDSATN